LLDIEDTLLEEEYGSEEELDVLCLDEEVQLDVDLLDTSNELDALLLTSLNELLECDADESAKEDDDLAAELGRLARLDEPPIIELCDELDNRTALEAPACD